MKNKRIISILFFSVVILICGCSTNENVGSSPTQGNGNNNSNSNSNENPAYSLLFIGNSLTLSNDLPNLVKSYAKAQGKDLLVETIAYGNYALIDHWNDGAIQSRIESENYDFVIVQQGPSSQPYGRNLLIEYGGYISDLCRNNNAKLAYYMVWPSLTYYHTFDGVIQSYRMAAEMNNDILCPVGVVWKSHFDETKDFSYYGPDGFHPSLAGSNVAAQVIYESLFND